MVVEVCVGGGMMELEVEAEWRVEEREREA